MSPEAVRIQLSGGGPWGFRLMGGGQDLLIVAKIRKKSKSHNVKMEEGDILLEINGRDCSSKTHQEAMEWIEAAGSSLALKLLRGDPRTAFLRQIDDKNANAVSPSFTVTVSTRDNEPAVQTQMTTHKRVITEHVSDGDQTRETRTETVTQNVDGATAKWTRNNVVDTASRANEENGNLTLIPISVETSPPKPFSNAAVEAGRSQFTSLPTDTNRIAKPFKPFSPVGTNSPSHISPSYEIGTTIPITMETNDSGKENTNPTPNVPDFRFRTISAKTEIWSPLGVFTKCSGGSPQDFGTTPLETSSPVGSSEGWQGVPGVEAKPPVASKPPIRQPIRVEMQAAVWAPAEAPRHHHHHHHHQARSSEVDSGYQEVPIEHHHHIPGMISSVVEPPPELYLDLNLAQYMYHSSSGSNPMSPKTPDSLRRKSNKKLFSDSTFYDEPGELYPTIEEQMDLCRKVAISLEAAVNRKARGAKMYAKRKRRSAKWTFEGASGYSSDASLSELTAGRLRPDDDSASNLTDASRVSLLNQLHAHQQLRDSQQPTAHGVEQLQLQQLPKPVVPKAPGTTVVWKPQVQPKPKAPPPPLLPVHAVIPEPPPLPNVRLPYTGIASVNKKVYNSQELENMMLSGEKTYPGVSPQIAMGIVHDLNASRGKGGRIFAKKKARAEKWVIDEKNVKAPPPRQTTLNQKVENLQQHTPRLKDQIDVAKAYKSPWIAAMESPYGDISSAFEKPPQTPVFSPLSSSLDLTDSYTPPANLPTPPASWRRTQSDSSQQSRMMNAPKIGPTFDATKPITPSTSQESFNTTPSVNVHQFRSLFEGSPQENINSSNQSLNDRVTTPQSAAQFGNFNPKSRGWACGDSSSNVDTPQPHISNKQAKPMRVAPPTPPKPNAKPPRKNFNPKPKAWAHEQRHDNQPWSSESEDESQAQRRHQSKFQGYPGQCQSSQHSSSAISPVPPSPSAVIPSYRPMSLKAAMTASKPATSYGNHTSYGMATPPNQSYIVVSDL